ncbi:MAG TPA: heavy-metal-associated domain-containing protein [Puia sp.]|nr:heavy-metal-associated domain-containing protein [Puia sp.]
MSTLQFKTNIDCGGCVARVTPRLNETKGILSWKVDTDNPDKILTVETEALGSENIIEVVKKVGFNIEPLKK